MWKGILKALCFIQNGAWFRFITKRNTIFISIIKSQFRYCPLLLMFYSRTSNNTFNKIHERALRITPDNKFEVPTKSQDITNHHSNIQILMTEIFKVVNNLSHPVTDIFLTIRDNHYILRSFPEYVPLLKLDLNPEPPSSWTNTQPFGQTECNLMVLKPINNDRHSSGHCYVRL